MKKNKNNKKALLLALLLLLPLITSFKFNLFYGKVVYSKFWWQSKIVRHSKEYPAVVGSFVKENDVIVVGPYAELEIRFVDNSTLKLKQNSTVTIQKGRFYRHRKQEYRDIAIKVNKGRLFLNSEKMKGKIQIQDKSIVIGIRGTLIYLNSSDTESDFGLLRGHVVLHSKKGDTSVHELKAGQTAVTHGNKLDIKYDTVFIAKKRAAYRAMEKDKQLYAPPEIILSKLTTVEYTNHPLALLDGVINKPNCIFYINGETIPLQNGYFSEKRKLKKGENIFNMVAIDTGNLVGERKYTIIYDNDKPRIQVLAKHIYSDKIILQGVVSDKTTTPYSLTMNGKKISILSKGFFRAQLKKADAVLIKLEDSAGNVTSKTIRIRARR